MAATKKIRSHRELEVYQVGFEAAMKIFEVTRHFPREETYSLTDQIRRSSRGCVRTLQRHGADGDMKAHLSIALIRPKLKLLKLKRGSSSRSNVATSTVRVAVNCMLLTTRFWASLSL